MRNSTPIRVGRQVVGKVEGDVFKKRLRANHFLKTPPAIAFDVSSLDDADRAGARRVEVENIDSKLIYHAPMLLIREKGFVVNRGFGAQIALALSYWQVTRPGGVFGEQLGLWK